MDNGQPQEFTIGFTYQVTDGQVLVKHLSAPQGFTPSQAMLFLLDGIKGVLVAEEASPIVRHPPSIVVPGMKPPPGVPGLG